MGVSRSEFCLRPAAEPVHPVADLQTIRLLLQAEFFRTITNDDQLHVWQCGQRVERQGKTFFRHQIADGE